jgi:two-component system sensor histidine kinase UhpB
MSRRKHVPDTLYNYSYHAQITSLVAAREEERKKIARELHDSVGQELTVLALDINRVLTDCRGLTDNMAIREASKTLQQSYDRVTALTTQVAHLSHLLHPSTLQHSGLRLSLKRLCIEMCTVTGLRIDFKCPLVLPKMSFDVSLCMYRIAQEALHNVSKHARASSVDVIVSKAPSAIDLRIKDDGRGFEPNDPRTREGVGLTSMAERARSLGGQFLLTTKTSGGTQIIARLPMK